LKKHGITPVHYSTGHLALVSRQGKILLDRVLKEIEKITPPVFPPDLILKNFRREEEENAPSTATFNTLPLRIARPGEESEPWSLSGKRVLLTPACPLSVEFLAKQDIKECQILGFLDRDRVVQGKIINGVPIHGYVAIAELNPDLILVVVPVQHRADIVQQLAKHTKYIDRIVVFDPENLGVHCERRSQEHH
jgi:hypothetical protein